ncbi:hypothetical protein, partial [Mycobacterium sp.]|uniref:hypothetical protein n=1 Tax=Mycobacterium sp. TaxID=1785 RepID=UPI003C70B987
MTKWCLLLETFWAGIGVAGSTYYVVPAEATTNKHHSRGMPVTVGPSLAVLLIGPAMTAAATLTAGHAVAVQLVSALTPVLTTVFTALS